MAHEIRIITLVAHSPFNMTPGSGVIRGIIRFTTIRRNTGLIAHLLERGKVDGVFVADTLNIR